MNTKNGQSDLDKIITPVYSENYVEQKDQEIASLQCKLTEKTDNHNEERFWWICYAIGSLDLLILKPEYHSSLVIFIICIELIFLTFIARKLGIDSVVIALDKLYNRICGSEDKNNGNNENSNNTEDSSKINL